MTCCRSIKGGTAVPCRAVRRRTGGSAESKGAKITWRWDVGRAGLELETGPTARTDRRVRAESAHGRIERTGKSGVLVRLVLFDIQLQQKRLQVLAIGEAELGSDARHLIRYGFGFGVKGRSRRATESRGASRSLPAHRPARRGPHPLPHKHLTPSPDHLHLHRSPASAPFNG